MIRVADGFKGTHIHHLRNNWIDLELIDMFKERASDTYFEFEWLPRHTFTECVRTKAINDLKARIHFCHRGGHRYSYSNSKYYIVLSYQTTFLWVVSLSNHSFLGLFTAFFHSLFMGFSRFVQVLLSSAINLWMKTYHLPKGLAKLGR